MNWWSLIPAGLGLLGGMFGGDKTSTTSTKLSPQLQKLAVKALTEAKDIWKTPYQAFTGDRVADPTQSRVALTPLMTDIGNKVQVGMNDGMGYRGRISDMLNGRAGRVSVPTMVPGKDVGGYQPGGGTVAPVPRSF